MSEYDKHYRSDESSNYYEDRSPLSVFLTGLGRLVKFYFIGVGVIFTLIPVLLISLFLWHSNGAQKTKLVGTSPKAWQPERPTILELNLSGVLRDQPEGFQEKIFRRLFGGAEQLSMSSLRTALRRVQKLPQVQGIFIKHGDLAANTTNLVELRRLLLETKDVGKKIYFWSPNLETDSFYLASVADDIGLAPAGSFFMPGPVFQLVYFGGLLKKIGIEVEVMRAGKFKNAFESFTMNHPSEETLKMYEAIEESLRGFLVEDIAATRNKSVEVVNSWLKQGIFTPEDSAKEGIIDQIEFADETQDRIEKKFTKDDEDVDFIKLKDFLRKTTGNDNKELGSKNDGLGYIYAEGVIAMENFDAGESQITPKDLRKEIEWMINNEDVKAVVLRLDSPGGSATASDLIWHDLKRLANNKPLVISMGETAASGGYYVSVAGQKIFAEATTITGSIGVITAIPKIKEVSEKYGVTFHMVTQSDRAKLLNPGEQSTAFDKQIVEHSIEATYDLFLARVAEGRNMKKENVHALAQGRVYTGRQALELGLIDDLGGINDAFNAAKELGGLNPQKLYNVYQYEGEEIDLSDCLMSISDALRCFAELESDSKLSLPIDQGLKLLLSSVRMKNIESVIALLAQHNKALMLAPIAFQSNIDRRP